MTSTRFFWASFATLVSLAAASPTSTSAQLGLRYQVDQEGDFVMFGNTLAQDCANGTPDPIVGTVGECGSNVSDSSPDVFWRADDPMADDARADLTIDAADARSTAVLALPPGAVITYARMYWAAMASGTNADPAISVERPGTFATMITADASDTVMADTEVLYQSTADVTALVQEHGEGAYRISDVDSIFLADIARSRAFVTWSVVVFYELADEPLRQLTVFDGLAAAGTGSGVNVNVSGFLVPNGGIDAKLGVMAYGSDGQTGGDTLSFNGTEVSDGLGGTNNFFNGSRMFLGSPVSVVGDLPQLTGGERSFAGVDLDVVDVTALVAPASTSANVTAKAGGDNNVMIGGLVTSITTFRPNFDDTVKSAEDVNGGLLLPGDVLRYTIDLVNTGNDPAVDVRIEDVLPAGVTFVSGSISIVDGFNDGTKTDASGDDQAEYDPVTHTITARLGEGANATMGGMIPIDDPPTTDGTATVTFDVIISDDAVGIVQNQVTITASGQNGAPEDTFTSTDGEGSETTDVLIDECQTGADCPLSLPQCLLNADPLIPNVCVECLINDHCSGTTPICELTGNTCVPCTDDAQCTMPGTPACNLSGPLTGACTQCSADNDDACMTPTPQCLTAQGVCGCSNAAPDYDMECGASDSGIICSGLNGVCVAGCSTAAGRNGCPSDQFCSDMTGGVGFCIDQDCLSDDDCSAPTPICDLGVNPTMCVQCLVDDDCTDPLVCDSTDTKRCVECTTSDTTNCLPSGKGAACLTDNSCGCTGDPDCVTPSGGRVCESTSETCTVGCRGVGGNGCPNGQVCTSTTTEIGMCVACVSDDDCTGTRDRCDTAANVCVECLDANDCGPTAPVCASGACIGCSSDDDCTEPGLPACIMTGARSGQCGECTASNLDECDTDRPACLSTFVCGCVDTDGDAECGASDSGRVCNGSAGMCIDGCSTADGRNDCPADQVCSDQTGGIGTCLDHCNTDDDCVEAPNLVCDLAPVVHVCVECVGDGNCPTGEVCDLGQRVCVGCVDDDDCAAGEVCDTTPQVCVDCIDDDDCDTGEVCDTANQVCVQCVDDDDCADGQRCDTTSNTCVDCLTDEDCEEGQVCDPAAQTCVECVDDDDCVEGQVCNPQGQVCVECVADEDCMTDQVCDTDMNMCVGCVDDDDCDAMEVCDTTAQECVACNGDADCDSGQVCDMDARACVACVDDGDCENGDRCDPTSQECVACIDDADCSDQTRCVDAMCVGCVTDDDCMNDEVCDEDTATCVECTTEKADACTPEGAGMLCLDNNTCGCSGDSDCGDTDAGRVCDEDTERCIDGCRGEGGNGCASGMMCTSDDDSIGTCEPEEEPEPEPMADGVIEGGGCSCSVPAGHGEAPWRSVLAGLLLVGLRLRRRSRRARR